MPDNKPTVTNDLLVTKWYLVMTLQCEMSCMIDMRIRSNIVAMTDGIPRLNSTLRDGIKESTEY